MREGISINSSLQHELKRSKPFTKHNKFYSVERKLLYQLYEHICIYITFEKTAHARVHNIKYSCCNSKYERIVLNLLQPVVVACINTQCKLT